MSISMSKRSRQEDGTAQSSKRRRSLENGDSVDSQEQPHSNGDATHLGANVNHVRFGSEEAEEALDLDGVNEEVHDAPDGGLGQDSDDEAPEALDAAEAQASARADAAGAARAFQRERATARQRRKDTDARLKAQAGSSTKKAKLSTTSQKATEGSGTDDQGNARKRKSLPDLLPEDVLESLDTRTSPEAEDEKPGRVPETAATPPKRTLVRFDANPKDVQAGPVKVRVLDGPSQYLAPKANKSSRSIRENWLRGRRGKVDPAAEHKKPSRGFLRA